MSKLRNYDIDVGNAINQLVPVVDVGGAVPGLPPLDGSQLTNLPGGGGGSNIPFFMTAGTPPNFTITAPELGVIADDTVINIAFHAEVYDQLADLSINGEAPLGIIDNFGNPSGGENFSLLPYSPLGTGQFVIYQAVRYSGYGAYIILGTQAPPISEIIEIAAGGLSTINTSYAFVYTNDYGNERAPIFRNGVRLNEYEDYTINPLDRTELNLTVPTDVTDGPEYFEVINNP